MTLVGSKKRLTMKAAIVPAIGILTTAAKLEETSPIIVAGAVAGAVVRINGLAMGMIWRQGFGICRNLRKWQE